MMFNFNILVVNCIVNLAVVISLNYKKDTNIVLLRMLFAFISSVDSHNIIEAISAYKITCISCALSKF